MNAATAAILLWTSMTTAPTLEGKATYYDEGIMQRVIANRGWDYADGVALNRAGDLGRTVWLLWEDGTIDGPLPVVDCAQRDHYRTREDQSRVVEVSAELAQKRGFYGVGPVPVTVLFHEPMEGWE